MVLGGSNLRSKRQDIIRVAREAVSQGRYIYSKHAIERQKDRDISDGDVRFAIGNGWHEKKKDAWIEKFQSWNYAIRGKSLEESPLRIVVNLDELDQLVLIVITVINLDL